MTTQHPPPPPPPPPSFPPTPLPPTYNLLTTHPTVQTYTHLRLISGLSPKSPSSAAAGLPSTLHSAQIQHDPTSTIVAMGRIVGDGALFFLIVDIAVDPAHQGKGLGKAVVGELMRWVWERTEDGDGAYVSLVADGEAWRLYAGFGFVDVGEMGSRGMGWERR